MQVRSAVGTVGPVVAGAVLSVGPLLRFGGPTPADVVVTLLAWAPALARARAPLPAFGVSVAVVVGWWLVHGLELRYLLPAGAAVLLLLVWVVDRCAPRTAAAAVATCLAVPVLAGAAALAGRPGGAAVVPLAAVTVTAAVVGRDRRTRRAYLEALEDRAARAERERDARARVAVVEERARIARELHDVVAHNLSVMTALADGAGFAPGTGQAREAVAQIAATGRQALAEMHRLVGVLRTDDDPAERAPAPGLADLTGVVEQVRAAGLPTVLRVTGRPRPLPAGAQLAVHRLVQEALTNTLRHARGARSAEVRLDWRAAELAVEVTDDGAPAAAAPDRAGHGLVGMRERVAAWDGSVTAGPRPAGGWRVAAVLPLAAARVEEDGAPVAAP
ncbi:sensor histidine kinase [Geodermatophilus tzadiensis]|uniref:sensor histidine kinase n=1 Tax=Geodermatophilus tzadiensis TaxID=1137988 RepID=UPI001B807493|nr:histidine kinase [Geodermatophilus tzadiensis]